MLISRSAASAAKFSKVLAPATRTRRVTAARAMASDACCSAGKPVVHDYTPLGKRASIAVPDAPELPVYTSGSGPLGVVVITDIFGFGYNQVFQVCDRFAAAGLNVVAIDTFRGAAWTKDRFPPKPEHGFMPWLTKEGSWDKLKPDIYAAVAHLRAHGAAKMGCIGFCWGASIAMHAGEDGATFSAVGGAHPALFGKEAQLAQHLACPLVLLPAQGDLDVSGIQAVTDKQPWGGKCVYKRYDDQIHGFCAARGDWDKPEVAAAAGEAIDVMSSFLKHAMA